MIFCLVIPLGAWVGLSPSSFPMTGANEHPCQRKCLSSYQSCQRTRSIDKCRDGYRATLSPDTGNFIGSIWRRVWRGA